MAATKKTKSIPLADRPMNSRLRKSIFILPNLLTASNMVLGLLSIVFAINDSLTLSLAGESAIPFVLPAKLIIIAAFLDFTDGFVARATGTSSRFGMEFDSLSDLVSFGVAPGLLIYMSVLRNIPILGVGLSITMLYIVCTAIRLARFNVQAQVEEKSHFMGLPSPAAAGLLASYVLFAHYEGWYEKTIIVNKVMHWYEENVNLWELYLIPIMTVLLALVMVSTISYPSLKKLSWETVKPWTFAFIILLVFFLIYSMEFTSFALLSFYLIWGILRALTRKSFEKMRPKKVLAT
jgi:CDP-diacylglycerol--serine O-phosphatidyltransferase